MKKDKTHMRIKEDFKTEDYYRSVLKKYEADVVLFKDKIASSETRTNMQYVIVTDDISRIVKLKYVLGYDLSDIKEIALDYIDYLGQKTEFKPEELTYNEMACALSYAYLFDIDYALLEYVKGHMVRESFTDVVLDVVRHIVFERKAYSDKTYYFKDSGYMGGSTKAKGGLVDVCNASLNERTDLFVKHLAAVKGKHHKRLLKNYEEIGENRYVYAGSYDFLLTAFAKALQMNKEKLEPSIFIAKDLLP